MEQSRRLPIIYVRGFADPGTVDKSVEDPFYGFNTGSTYVRAGVEGKIRFYQFESPLLRLMIDHDYRLFVYGNQTSWLQGQQDGSVEAPTIWIYRFYDTASEFGGNQREPFNIEAAAQGLLELIDTIRAKTGAPRVHLVAHSMGGLICRCLIQKIIPDKSGHATDYVDRLFTYATPHGGINFDVGFGLIERLRDLTGIRGTDIFGPDRMWEYLNPSPAGPRPRDWKPQLMDDEDFPKDRIFTLVGTNHGDFEMGVSSWAVGPKSDGLVQTESAYIPGARFAFVHRSHSGRYGIVNSEAGYQNLRRFLFGDLEATADLVGLRLPGGPERSWQADVEASVRGQSILMHEQVARHLCPVILTSPSDDGDQPNPLVTTFLISDSTLRPSGHNENRYILKLRIFSLVEREGLGRIFDFVNHQEQIADFDDDLLIDIALHNGKTAAWATWVSQITTRLEDYRPTGEPLQGKSPQPGLWTTYFSLPAKGKALFGAHAQIRLTVRVR
ncbi:esterase/lipase family protein [Corynebacterium sp. A21]|uniref:esterase/lipase family protein n=1 Tax=Corynebacterium sp. A21 TaxID=3457318 RepID=UPI003FD2A57A